MDRVVIPSDIPWLRGVTVERCKDFFMFGIYTGYGFRSWILLIESQTGSHLLGYWAAPCSAPSTVFISGGGSRGVKTFGCVVLVLVTLTTSLR